MFIFLLFFVNIRVIGAVVEGGSVFGKVVGNNETIGLEYVTIAIYRTSDKKLVGGTITKADGVFKVDGLQLGSYYLDVSFIGYKRQQIKNVVIKQKNQKVDLGIVVIGEDLAQIDEIEVVVERADVEFKLDKKVINVSKYYTAVSGSAVNVLENVPSVTVDIEGNVLLRGSTGFTVLIDGVPSILESSEALQQIPVSTIQNIEIITNPSANYNPDGNAGIINVITKRNRASGVNGVLNFKAGTNNLGGDFQLSLQQKKTSYFLGGDYNYGNYPGEKKGHRTSYSNDTIYSVKHNGDIRSKFDRHNLRGGFEFRFDSLKSVNLDVTYGENRSHSYAELNYLENDNFKENAYRYLSDEVLYRGTDGVSANAVYVQRFVGDRNMLKAAVSFKESDSDEYNENELRDENNHIIERRKNTEKGPVMQWQLKVDYEKKVGKQGNIETGYQSTFNRNEDVTGLSEDMNVYGINTSHLPYSNKIKYSQDIHAMYFIYGSQKAKFGYQFGLRAEYTNREIGVLDSESTNIIGDQNSSVNRFDYFPSVHLSYKLPANQELMASYSKRIKRSRSYHFEPFYTWVDAFNIRHGNSNLQSEYIDSYELNYMKKMEKSYFSFETYYSITNNKIEWVRSVYHDNIIQRFPENVGKDYYLGIDATYSFDLAKKWRVDLSGSLYNYKIKGQWADYNFDEERLTWSYRVNQTLKLNSKTQLQGNWRYYSKRITSQGIYQPVYTFDIAFKKEFMDRKLTSVVELRDVFSTNNRENTNNGIAFNDHYFQKIHTPVLTFVITYRFNNYKDRKKRSGDSNFGGDESMER